MSRAPRRRVPAAVAGGGAEGGLGVRVAGMGEGAVAAVDMHRGRAAGGAVGVAEVRMGVLEEAGSAEAVAGVAGGMASG